YIYQHLEELDIKDGIKAKLKLGEEKAYLSRWLGTINTEAPIDKNIQSYTILPSDQKKLSALMTKLEFFKLMERMGITPALPTQEASQEPPVEFKTADFKISDISTIADIYIENERIAAINQNTIYELTNTDLICLLKSDIKKRVFDLKNLSKAYETKNVFFDAMLAGYLLNPASNDYSIPRLITEYAISTPKIAGDSDNFLVSAATFNRLCDKLESSLKDTDQYNLLCDIEVPLSLVLGEMEKIGFLVNKEGLISQGEELSQRIDEIKSDIYRLAGGEFNINSPKQLGEVLFVKLGLPAKKKTKSGFSTNAEVLEDLKYNYPIVRHILLYRQLTKLKSTYCDGLLSAISEDGRIHSTFNQTEARTGRISSLEPNLQNIPVRTDEGKKLREYFTAKDGYVLCDADYSQIELRVLASISDDETMINAFNSGVDIHTATASEVFDIPIDMVLPVMRSRAKAVNFGIVYGIGAFSLSKDIGVTRAEADRYIKNYLSTYQDVDLYMKQVIEKAKTDGFVKTLFGRRRYLPELSSSNGMMRAFGERVARNAPIQGTAADIIKLAMINVSRRLKLELPKARLILQVHDELIVECPECDANATCTILKEEMENAAKLKVKLCVDANVGKNWLEAKG
ncbi:MAG: DNA polymerase I, partial [Clostridia bacterium]|nr:DNA polymerase I [Clostridia bacterium]